MDRSALFADINKLRDNKNVVDDKKVKKANKSKSPPKPKSPKATVRPSKTKSIPTVNSINKSESTHQPLSLPSPEASVVRSLSTISFSFLLFIIHLLIPRKSQFNIPIISLYVISNIQNSNRRKSTRKKKKKKRKTATSPEASASTINVHEDSLDDAEYARYATRSESRDRFVSIRFIRINYHFLSIDISLYVQYDHILALLKWDKIHRNTLYMFLDSDFKPFEF